MSPATRAAIDAAEDLAWRPTSNLPGSLRYHERKEAHQRLCERLAAVRLSANASPELRFLIAAARRAAGCSFANRMGRPYYERRTAIYELRGCLVVWKRSVGLAA